MSAIGIIFLILFCAVIFSSYIIIRRDWMRTQVVGGLCAALSFTSILAFGLAEDLGIVHAVVAALIVSLIFTGAMVAMAVFFAKNQPQDIEAYLQPDEGSSTN